MTATNGAAGGTDLKSQIREQRLQAKLLEAQMRRGALERAAKRQQRRLTESQEEWFPVGAYEAIFDRLSSADSDLVLPVSTAMDRRYGANWPFWRTWLEHARLRAGARLMHGLSTLAQGALRGLTNYVIGEGFAFRAAPRPGENPPDALVGAVQTTIDEFSQQNDWPKFQRELFLRSRRDGEFFLRDFPQDDGMLLVRPVEPEWVLEPPNYDPLEWSFGIHTEPQDRLSVLGYWLAYDGFTDKGDEVSADDVLHVKVNVDSTVKRGLTDLCFDTYDSFKSAQSLLENLSEGSAIQASIAFFRQHDQSTQSEVAGFVSANNDFADGPGPGPKKAEKFYPGKIVDGSKGINFVVPPFAANAQGFAAVAGVVLRCLAVKWNAPEWLISGDASNNNYSSSITAESPFVKSCKAEQSTVYKPAFLRTVRSAVKAKCDAGKLRAGGRVWLWEEVQRMVDVLCEPPTIEVRNKLEEAQTNQIRIQAGAFSPQMWCQEENIDYDQVAQDNEDHRQATGGQAADLPLSDKDPVIPPKEPPGGGIAKTDAAAQGPVK